MMTLSIQMITGSSLLSVLYDGKMDKTAMLCMHSVLRNWPTCNMWIISQRLVRKASASINFLEWLELLHSSFRTCAQATKAGRPKYRPSETQRTLRQLHAVDIGLECMQHPPRPVTGEHLVRLLRQVQALQVMPGQRASLQLEQAYALMLAGNISDAYDTLAVILTGAADPGNKYMAEALCGLIRHTQWANTMRSAAVPSQAQQSPGRRKVDSAVGGGIDWFVHDPVLVAAAGRSASEFWKDAERHLKAALAIQPTASNLSYTLVQMYCAVGKQSQALEAVGQLCKLAPEDADVHALHLLLLKAQGIVDHDQASIAGEACHQLLLCDPGAHSAANFLVGLTALNPLPPAALADALMLHLEVCSVSGHALGPATQCAAQSQPHDSAQPQQDPAAPANGIDCAAATWAALAELLTSCARRALQASDAAHSQSSASNPSQHPQDIQQSPMEDSAEGAAVASRNDWAELQPVLQARAWWWGRHVLRTACIESLIGGANKTLAAMVRSAAFVLGGNGNTFCREAMSALQAAQAEELCQQLEECLELSKALTDRQVDRRVSQEPVPVNRPVFPYEAGMLSGVAV
ncbi:hypothetical protein COCOBI_04-3480 [Coccomyxa sp. Obi]|nr:hypothetical protein COCOBI_04-3480 [Coccomyxa sp. Obi]